MKILVAGARGQLGEDLARLLAGRDVTALDRGGLDVTDASAVAACVAALAPDVVLNAAAWNKVDDAEDQLEEAFRVNALAPRFLAQACHTAGALLVHFSTDYVFGGDARTSHREEDPPRPLGVYAASKLVGEHLVAATCARHMIVRTSGLYGLHGRGGNFADTMLRLAAEAKTVRVVNDQVLTPTFSEDLARKTVEIVDRWARHRSEDLLGLWHVTNAGRCTWYEFAAEIFRVRGLAVDLRPIGTREYGARAPRPACSVLAHGHLERAGLDDLRDWRAALADYLRRRA